MSFLSCGSVENIPYTVMKIVIDDKIPYIHDAVAGLGVEAVYIAGGDIGPADVRDADALIVRTRTKCDSALLCGSRVSFVATATIGHDHIDSEYMARAGIAWMNCPGCNSSSVAQYLRSVLLLLWREKGIIPAHTTIGVVGMGHVGSKVAAVASAMGMRVLVCDPPCAEKGVVCGYGEFMTLEQIGHECDVITFHVPLTREGRHATYHLADRTFFDGLCRRPVIINTSRGEVVDNAALIDALYINKVKDAVIDTWENEPDIDRRLLDMAYIATPHIAGYSADGKVNADNMVLEGLCRHFGLEKPDRIQPPVLPQDVVERIEKLRLTCGTDNAACVEGDIALTLYNPLNDSANLKNAPHRFEELRGNYPLRREKW